MPEGYKGDDPKNFEQEETMTLAEQTEFELSQTRQTWSQERYFTHNLLKYVRDTKDGVDQLS